MEEWLFLHGIELNGAKISPWYVQFSAFVESDAAYPVPIFTDDATMSAGITFQLTTPEIAVEGAFAGVPLQQFLKGYFLGLSHVATISDLSP
jgi:hypothetical protein